jgi:hypothetical protein
VRFRIWNVMESALVESRKGMRRVKTDAVEEQEDR